MAPPLALRIGLLLLVADGCVALYLGDLIGPRGAALVALLLAGSAWAQSRDLAAGATHPGLRLVVPLAAVASLADVLHFAESVLDGLARLLVFLVLYKLATLRTVVETRVVGFLALFMLIAASTSAFGVGYLFVLVAFLGLATWVAMVQHQLMEACRPGGLPDPASVLPARALLGLAAVAGAGVAVVAAGFFLVLPRVGLAALPLRSRLGPAVSGFSEEVAIGAYGSIVASASVAMRVHLPEVDDPSALPGLRWRGIALDTFDGRTWSVHHPRRMRAVLATGGGFDVGVLRGPGRVLRQEVYLEPIGTEVLFAAARPLRVSAPGGVLLVDDMGSLSVASPGARLHYTVESVLEAPGGGGRAPVPPLDAATTARHLQLPPLPPGIRALALEVAGDSREPREVIARLLAFFGREFRYSLDLAPTTRLDPLEEFLLVRRAGHCEYFAAAMAVMLRSLGIPARLVNGFQRGEWNPYGRYFLVRLLDAHSWVEAHLAGEGWVTLDPTPRASGEPFAPPGSLLLYLDAVRLAWHRHVIGWSLRDQVHAASTLQARVHAWSDRLWSARAHLRGPATVIVVGLGALAVGVRLWRREHRAGRAPGGRGTAVPAFYRQALRRLHRRGLDRGPGETAREFEARVAALGGSAAGAFARVTAAYERTRFAGHPPTPAERLQLRAAVRQIGADRRPSRRRPDVPPAPAP